MRRSFTLPCGCRSCGCLCESHAPSGLEHPCPRHAAVAVSRWIAGEVLALIALGLLIASVGVWAAILPALK